MTEENSCFNSSRKRKITKNLGSIYEMTNESILKKKLKNHTPIIEETRLHVKKLEKWLERYIPSNFLQEDNVENRELIKQILGITKSVEYDSNNSNIDISVKKGDYQKKNKHDFTSSQMIFLTKNREFKDSFSILIYKALLNYLKNFSNKSSFTLFVETIIEYDQLLKKRENKDKKLK